MWFFMELSFGSHLAQCVHEEQGRPDSFIHERRKQGQDPRYRSKAHQIQEPNNVPRVNIFAGDITIDCTLNIIII